MKTIFFVLDMKNLKRKTEYREWAKDLRQELNLELASKRVIEKIVNLDVYKSAKTVMSYHPKKIEISLLDLLLDNSKKWFLPVVCSQQSAISSQPSSLIAQKSEIRNPQSAIYNLLVVPYVSGKTKLIKGRFNIMEPEIVGDNFFDQLNRKIEIDLIFVPGLCFDKAGNRIGFGMGFYDSFLKLNMLSFKIGVCPKECLVSSLPQNPQDIRVDLVITD